MGDGWTEDDTSTNTSGNNVQQNGTAVHPPGTAVHPSGTVVHPSGTAVHPPGTAVHPPGTAVHPPVANQNRSLSTAQISRSVASPKTPFDALVPADFGTDPPPVRNHQYLEWTFALNTTSFTISNFSNELNIDIH